MGERELTWPRVGALVGSIAGTMFYAGDALGTAVSKQRFGIDFGVFHAGGRLVSEGRFRAVYDPDVFSPYLAAGYFPSIEGEEALAHFISPPPFGWLMQAFSYLPFRPALAMWLFIGIALLFVAARLLELPRWAPYAMLLSPAMASSVTIGQGAPVFLTIFVGIHMLIKKDRLVLAGLVAGLLIIKPTLAIGYGLWWVFRIKKWYPSCIAAAASGLVVALPTLVTGFGPWRGFLDALQFRVAVDGSWQQQSLGLSEFLKLADPGGGSSATLVAWGIAIAAGLGMIIAADRRWRPDLELMSAVAVLVTVLAAPHLLIYDGLLLVIPLAVAYSRGALDRDRFMNLAAVHVVTLAAGAPLFVAQYKWFGRGIGVELLGYVVCIALLAKYLGPRPIDRDEARVAVPIGSRGG